MDLSSATHSRHGPRARPGGTLSSPVPQPGVTMTRCPGASSSRFVRGRRFSLDVCADSLGGALGSSGRQPQATRPPGGRVVSPWPLGSAHKCSTAAK